MDKNNKIVVNDLRKLNKRINCLDFNIKRQIYTRKYVEILLNYNCKTKDINSILTDIQHLNYDIDCDM